MTKTVNISLPEALLKEIDKAAKGDYASRSDFIRETLVRRLKGQRIVEEDRWETVVDFRQISPEGAPAKDVLKALEQLISD